MPGSLSHWFRHHAYGQFTYRVLLALGSALVTVALSFLPYDTLLQAIWVVLSSMVIGYLFLRQRLNESDEARYRRLFRGRFAFLERTDPEALTTIFADNIRPSVLKWFEAEYQVEIAKAKNIDALDSLSRVGDQPGQLLLRFGVEMGRWLDSDSKNNSADRLEEHIEQFVENNRSLLGKEIAPGIYTRRLSRGDQRPVGVHLFHPASRCLFTVEAYDSEEQVFSAALSLKASLFAGLNDEQWNSFRAAVLEEFPMFQPARGGSGPQKQQIPLFVRAGLETWTETEDATADRLERLLESLPRR